MAVAGLAGRLTGRCREVAWSFRAGQLAGVEGGQQREGLGGAAARLGVVNDDLLALGGGIGKRW
jgi:hypothetical protein